MSKPGEVVDHRGVPIYPGDLLRTFHFRDRRRKKHYLYHVAVLCDDGMWLIPTSHLEPTLVAGGGTYQLSQTGITDYEIEVIHGHGPDDYLSFEDRPRREVPYVPAPRWQVSGNLL